MMQPAVLFDRYCRRRQVSDDARARILGVSLGRRADRATWRIRWRDDATPAQRATEATLIAGFDASAEALLEKDDRANQVSTGSDRESLVLRAMVGVMAGHLGVQPAQLLDEVRTEIRRLL